MKIFIYYVVWIISCHVILTEKYYNEESLQATLELIDMDLYDTCEEMAVNLRKSLLQNPVNFSEKIVIENKYGNYLKGQQQEFDVGENTYPFHRNLTLLAKPGVWLLPEETLLKVLTYSNTYEESNYNFKELDDVTNQNITKQDFLDVLSSSRNKTLLENIWSTWQFSLHYGKPYKPFLQTLSKSAALYDYNVKEYWEMLAEYENAYQISEDLWKTIEPFYSKVQSFVLNRINAHYNTNYTYVPAFLSGTNFAEDWSNIADILLPHSQLLYDINYNLKGKSNRDAFILAEKMMKELGLGGLGKNFWSNSSFSLNSCENVINPYCATKYSEVLTCNKLDWNKYLNAHESAMRVILNNKDYVALMRMKLRYSMFDEAVTSLSSIFAMEYLPMNSILPKDIFNEYGEDGNNNNKMTALLLLAMRILPKLPYYLIADKWRLDELEYESDNLTSSWWEYRKNYQGVQGVNNKEPDFMTDSHFITNKPYISKFLGLILQFQLLDYMQVGLFVEDSQVINSFHNDETFRTAVLDRPNRGGTDLLSYHFSINEISADSLLTYFAPLEEYIEQYADHKEPIIAKTIVTTKKPKIVKSVEIDPIKSSVLNDKNDTMKLINETTTISPKEVIIPNAKPNDDSIPKESNSYILIIVLVCVLAVAVIGYFIFKYARRRRKFQRNRRENTDV